MKRIIAALLFLFLFTPLALAESNTCDEKACIAVVDAGSTGSRLHVYAYDLDETKTPIHIQELWNKKVKPGLATIEPNDASIDAYFTSLMANAPVHPMPIYVYATAGMRLLPQTKQQKIYTSIEHWFQGHEPWHLMSARTITGNDEAVFDWLAVNDTPGTLDPDDERSIGVMDMGGASVQIAFRLQKNQDIMRGHSIEITLFGKPIRLYVHSFLGLGRNEFSHQFLNTPSCFMNNYPLPDGEQGQGNADDCEQQVSSLLNGVHKVNQDIQPVLTQNPVDGWYAMDGISLVLDSPFFQFKDHQLTNQDFLQQTNDHLCQQAWDNMNAQYPNDDNLYQYCLLSSYYYALMVDGYGISRESVIHYFSAAQNVDWTRGVVFQRV